MFIMASKNTQVNHPKRIAEYYNKLYWLAMKLHNTAASIGFIKKALYTHVTVNLAKLKGSLPIMKKNIKLKADRSFLNMRIGLRRQQNYIIKFQEN